MIVIISSFIPLLNSGLRGYIISETYDILNFVFNNTITRTDIFTIHKLIKNNTYNTNIT